MILTECGEAEVMKVGERLRKMALTLKSRSGETRFM